jgi:hypothetical protein
MAERSRAWEWWGLAGIGLVVGILKFFYEPNLRVAMDGSFYMNVAKHVADGDGLATTLSLYRQGFLEFPHVSLIYPIWPLLLGAGASVMGVFRAARIVPEVLFGLDLILVFLFTRAVSTWAARHTDGRLPWYRSRGAIALSVTLLFASNHVLFRYSSQPYTEPLALAFTLGALLALFRFGTRERIGWAVLAAVLASAAYLTRSQCAGVLGGILGALALAAVRERLARRALVAAGAASLATMLPWFLWVAKTARPFDPRLLLNFAAYRETPGLPPFEIFVPTDGPVELLIDRASGLFVAFDPVSPFSYVFSWGPAAYLVLVATAMLLWRVSDTPKLLRSAMTIRGASMTAVVAAGVGALVPVHLLHSEYVFEWWFGHRYGLFLVLLIVPAIVYLLRAGRIAHRIYLALLGLSVMWGGIYIAATLVRDRPEPTPARLALEAWLGTQGGSVFLATNPQPLSLYTEAGFHWIQCEDPPAVTRAMITALPIDFVIFKPEDHECAFFDGLSRLRQVRRFGAGESEIAVFSAEADSNVAR